MTCKCFAKRKTYMLGIITQLPNKRLNNEKYLLVIVGYIDHIVLYLIQVLQHLVKL